MARTNPSLVRVARKIFVVRDSSLDASLRNGRRRVIGEPLVAAAIRIGIEEVILRVVRASTERLVGHEGALGAEIQRHAIVGVPGDVPGEDVVTRRRTDSTASRADRAKIRASYIRADVAVGLSLRIGDAIRR